MEGQISPSTRTARVKSAHLMCGSKVWTIVAFVSCSYFARVAYVRLHTANLNWSHDSLDIATHLVWVIFLVGLITETRCWKERVFFTLVLLNFALAFAMGLWTSAPDSAISNTRMISAAAWGLAALVGLALIFTRAEKPVLEKTP